MNTRIVWACALLVIAACQSGPPHETSPPSGARAPAASADVAPAAAPGAGGDTVTPAPDRGPAPGANRTAAPRPPQYPTRLAEGPDGRIYVSDARAGAVFVCDRELRVVDAIRGLDGPLGVAVDDDGNVYVGLPSRRAVAVYDAAGDGLRDIGAGTLAMPNDLAIDRGDGSGDGRLYVADSRGDVVRVFRLDGTPVTTIGGDTSGPGRLRFPAAVAVARRARPGGGVTGELYVADQGNFRIQVYDLDGRHLRSLGTAAEAFSAEWQGRFVRLQSVAVDAVGRVHAADCYENRVQLLDAETGDFLGSYGDSGDAGQRVALPLDILIARDGRVVAASAARGWAGLQVVRGAGSPAEGATER